MLLKLLIENFTIFVHLNEMKLRAYLCLILSHFLTRFVQILNNNLLKFLRLHFIHLNLPKRCQFLPVTPVTNAFVLNGSYGRSRSYKVCFLRHRRQKKSLSVRPWVTRLEYPIKMPLRAPLQGRLLALPINIRLGCRWWTLT